MRAEALVNRRINFGDGAFAEVVIWLVPQPVRGSRHRFKYRLAYVVDEVCVMRFDNEAGKGDHIHRAGRETAYVFTTTEKLLSDFFAEIDEVRDENSDGPD